MDKISIYDLAVCEYKTATAMLDTLQLQVATQMNYLRTVKQDEEVKRVFRKLEEEQSALGHLRSTIYGAFCHEDYRTVARGYEMVAEYAMKYIGNDECKWI
jgi:hypothetical protein